MLQYKIAILGKAKSGKNTAALFCHHFLNLNDEETKIIGLANEIKYIAKIMFPDIPDEYLFGNSELRESLVPNYDFTVRKVLTDIGKLGRSYDPDHWIKLLDRQYQRAQQTTKLFIVPDVRFINELNYFKANNFLCLRIKRNDATLLNDISETAQDEITDDKFDYILDNNQDKNHLYKQIAQILMK